ncbi:HIT family protein [Mesobacillus maritimus]|nr:HIT family protein [Mesobacillus maritimus]MCM3668602.1 HIT family protein [Mesobacillus maritimus]
MSECLGCLLAAKKLPVHVVYEDKWVCCILDGDPFNEGHVLILPKRHVEDFDHLENEMGIAIMQAAKLLSKVQKKLFQPEGITVCQNGGVFSDLTHFHMHVVPRYQHQNFALFYLDEPFNNAETKEKLAETATKMRERIRKMI